MMITKILTWIIAVLIMCSVVFGSTLSNGQDEYYSHTAGSLTGDYLGKVLTKTGSPSNTTGGKVNNAYNYTANGQYLSYTQATAITNISISSWLYTTGNGGYVPATAHAIPFGSAGSGTGGVTFISQGATAGSWIIYLWGKGTCQTHDLVGASGILPQNQWLHIAITIDGTAGTMKLFVNGVQNYTITNAACQGTYFPPSIIGDWTVESTSWYQGIIDETGFWNKTLSTSEVSELWNGGTGVFYPFSIYTPVINNATYNLTSASAGQNSTAWRNGNEATPIKTVDTTPTHIFDTILPAYCRCGIQDVNWTMMGDGRNASTTGGTNHICTIGVADALTLGYQSIYDACIDSTFTNETAASTSGALNVSVVNSCTPPVLTNVSWNVSFDDNCSINSDIDLGIGKLNVEGSGSFTVNSSIVSSGSSYSCTTLPCQVVINPAGKIIFNQIWCYQETANISTNCGGLNTGSYITTNTTDLGYMYVNYSKPKSSTSDSLWKIKTGAAPLVSGLTIFSVIPPSCWNYNNDTLTFRIIGLICDPEPYADSSCYNGSDWEILYHTPTPAGGGVASCEGVGGGESLWFDGNWDSRTGWSAVFGIFEIAPTNSDNGAVFEEAMLWRIR